MGAAMCAAMKDKLSRQMFEVVIQAAANGKTIARETLKVRLFELVLLGSSKRCVALHVINQ